MPLYICQICGNSYTRRDSLTRHMNTRHPKDAKDGYDSDYDDDDDDDSDDKDNVKDVDNGQLDNDNVKKTKRYDVFGQLRCHKCVQIFGSQELLEHHLRKKNHGFEQFPCRLCMGAFPTKKALDIHFQEKHTTCTSTIVFQHPSTMAVAGPTWSGKTSWVAKLLQNISKHFQPTPSRIVYCFRHWQPIYDRLKEMIPTIEWSDGLPTEETFSTYSNFLVILDDMI